MALSLHQIARAFRATPPFFCCLFAYWVQTAIVTWNTILVSVTNRWLHVSEMWGGHSQMPTPYHEVWGKEVSTAKQSQAPAKNLLKPAKLKSHSRAIKASLRPHRWQRAHLHRLGQSYPQVSLDLDYFSTLPKSKHKSWWQRNFHMWKRLKISAVLFGIWYFKINFGDGGERDQLALSPLVLASLSRSYMSLQPCSCYKANSLAQDDSKSTDCWPVSIHNF